MKTAIVYSSKTIKTKQVAHHIIKEIGENNITEIDAEEVSLKQLLDFDLIILGVPTWFDGELPEYWDILVPEIEQTDFSGKKIAIFGLGNQREYPENFVDAIGLMAEIFRNQGAEITGLTSTDGYSFESSYGLFEGKFCGLAIDTENQASLTKERIKVWVEDILK